MKYLKKFESIKNRYKVGDYVFLVSINEYDPYCKIIKVNCYDPTIHTPIQYTAKIFNNENDKFEEDYIEDSMIIRKMTKKEIFYFNNKKEILKFNI